MKEDLYTIIKTKIDEQRAQNKRPLLVFVKDLDISGLSDKELRDQLNGLYKRGLIKPVKTLNLDAVTII